MSLVATAMSDETTETVRYTSCKVDAEVIHIAKAAAAMAKLSVQEWVSDLINQHGSKALGVKPVKRKSPPCK